MNRPFFEAQTRASGSGCEFDPQLRQKSDTLHCEPETLLKMKTCSTCLSSTPLKNLRLWFVFAWVIDCIFGSMLWVVRIVTPAMETIWMTWETVEQ